MLNGVLVLIFIFLVILVFLLIGISNKRRAIHTYSVPFFMKSFTNMLDNEEQETLIEKLNDFFKDDHSKLLNGAGNIDDENDDGE